MKTVAVRSALAGVLGLAFVWAAPGAAEARPVVKKPGVLAPKAVERPAAAGAVASAAPSAAPAAAPVTALSAAEQAAVVAAHNALRTEVGVGPLAWDAALETYAKNHVATLVGACALAHSDGPHGENLASWTGANGPANSVALWGAEKPQYKGAGGPYAGPADGAGHYTQVIWGATTKVGCGRATCTKNGMQWTLVSCNYSPRGNVMGERVY